jgi:uncharacterized caspase-like protein
MDREVRALRAVRCTGCVTGAKRDAVRVIIIWLAASLVLFACRTTAVQNLTDVPVVSVSRETPSDATVRDAILVAGDKLKWVMTEPAKGEILGSYTVGGHMVQVSIPYTATQYSILYSSSDRMNYKDGVIHPKYNVWVAALNREIQSQLDPSAASLAAKPSGKPATAAAKPVAAAKVAAKPTANPPSAESETLGDADAAGELKGVGLGRYHALVIGINNYENLPKLKTAVTDARAVAQVLIDDYGYSVTLLTDINRDRLMEALDRYIATLRPSDNLLIYYAGHGHRDEASNRGYWLPSDATRDRRTRWVSNADISDTLKSLRAKHVMIVADSCYSGTLTRGAGVALRGPDYIRRMALKRARVVLSSGGVEPVADNAGAGHSPFADAFISALRSNPGVLDATRMFATVRNLVVQRSDQTPEFADIGEAGHEGGDFLFVRVRPAT